MNGDGVHDVKLTESVKSLQKTKNANIIVMYLWQKSKVVA